MKSSLCVWLVLPLIILIIISLAIHYWIWEADGLFLNAATEVGGILVTVLYVDWILKRHEKKQWHQMDCRINDRLRILLNKIISSIRSSIGIGPDILNDSAFLTKDLIQMHQEVIRVAENVLLPNLKPRISALNQAEWKLLREQIRYCAVGTMDFIQMFQDRISPDQLSLLLDLEKSLSASLDYYSTFPDVIGVSIDQLNKDVKKHQQIQKDGIDCSVRELRKVLEICSRISHSIP